MRLVQARAVLVLFVLSTAVQGELTSCPTITTGGPLRVSGRNTMCCTAPKKQNTYPSLYLSLGRGSEPITRPVSRIGDSAELCMTITVQARHHQMPLECSTVIYVNGVGRGCTKSIALYVFKMSRPKIAGPAAVRSREEHTFTCTVETVTYDNVDDFKLWWSVDGTANRNDRKTATSAGFLDTSGRRLALHSIRSRLIIRVPRNTGENEISVNLECVTWHKGLQELHASVTSSFSITVLPEQSTTTTTTTTTPPRNPSQSNPGVQISTSTASTTFSPRSPGGKASTVTTTQQRPQSPLPSTSISITTQQPLISSTTTTISEYTAENLESFVAPKKLQESWFLILMSIVGTLGVLLLFLCIGYFCRRCLQHDSKETGGKNGVIDRKIDYMYQPPKSSGAARPTAGPSSVGFRQASGAYYEEQSDYESSQASDLQSSTMSTSEATSTY